MTFIQIDTDNINKYDIGALRGIIAAFDQTPSASNLTASVDVNIGDVAEVQTMIEDLEKQVDTLVKERDEATTGYDRLTKDNLNLRNEIDELNKRFEGESLKKPEPEKEVETKPEPDAKKESAKEDESVLATKATYFIHEQTGEIIKAVKGDDITEYTEENGWDTTTRKVYSEYIKSKVAEEPKPDSIEKTNNYDDASEDANIAKQTFYFKNTETGEISRVGKGEDLSEFINGDIFEKATNAEYRKYIKSLKEPEDTSEKESKADKTDTLAKKDSTESTSETNDSTDEIEGSAAELFGISDQNVTFDTDKDVAKSILKFIKITGSTPQDANVIDKDLIAKVKEELEDNAVMTEFDAFDIYNKMVLKTPLNVEF